MAQEIQMSSSYFLSEDAIGNTPLSTFDQRVDDACKFLENGAVIKLDNGVLCSTREELLFAIKQAKGACVEGKQSDSSPIKKDNHSKVKTIVIIGLIIAAVVFFFTQINSSNSRKDEVVYYPSGYTVLKMALENGDVRLRMTYDEISDIIGGADNISKSNGKVKYAHYYQSEREAGGYTSKHIQLCFDENGYLYKINEN